MGANLPAKKYKHGNPTISRLSFEFDGGSTKFIDIARALSVVNRKFYRQGVYYYVNSIEVYNNETGVIDIHTLPDNWITRQAWIRGFKLYQKMNSMVDPPMSNMGRPKFHDFKVYMSELHYGAGDANPQMYNVNANNNARAPDEWAHSQFVTADDDQDATANADEFYVHMLGPHVGDPNNWESVGLIRSYGDTRIVPDSHEPDTDVDITGDPLVNLFDFSSEEQLNDIIENLTQDNDQPPYNYDDLIGNGAGDMQHVARIGTEVGVGRVGRAQGFCAPMGLICVDPHGVETAFRVVLNLAVGTYHGIYAERIQ